MSNAWQNITDYKNLSEDTWCDDYLSNTLYDSEVMFEWFLPKHA